MSNRTVIELLLQLKSAKAHGKSYIKVKPHLVRHLLRNRLFEVLFIPVSVTWDRNIKNVLFSQLHQTLLVEVGGRHLQTLILQKCKLRETLVQELYTFIIQSPQYNRPQR